MMNRRIQRCLWIGVSLFLVACGSADNSTTAGNNQNDNLPEWAMLDKSDTPGQGNACATKTYSEVIISSGGTASAYSVEHACGWAHHIAAGNAGDKAIENAKAGDKLNCDAGCVADGDPTASTVVKDEQIDSSGEDSKGKSDEWKNACKSFMLFVGGNPADCDAKYARTQKYYCNVTDTLDVLVEQKCKVKPVITPGGIGN